MMYVTVWNSYTNEVEQLYVPVDLGDQTDPAINRGRVPRIVHDWVCAYMEWNPKEYTISQEIRPLDKNAQETSVIIMVISHHDVEVITYSCRWQW